MLVVHHTPGLHQVLPTIRECGDVQIGPGPMKNIFNLITNIKVDFQIYCSFAQSNKSPLNGWKTYGGMR